MNSNACTQNETPPDSWCEWFMQHESAPIIDKTFKAKLFENFNAAITKQECKDKMMKQREIAFLFKMNFGQSKVDMIHHCQEIGGTLWRQVELLAQFKASNKMALA